MFGLRNFAKLASFKKALFSFQSKNLPKLKYLSSYPNQFALFSSSQTINQQSDITKNQQVSRTKEESNIEETLETYVKALDVLEKLSSTRTLESTEIKTMADIHLKKGSIYQTKNDLDKALKHFQKAMTLFLNYFGEDPSVAECYDNIGRLHYEKGSYNESLYNFFKAAQIYNNYSLELPLSKLYQEISLSYTAMGKDGDALEILRSCANLRKQFGEGYHEKTADAYIILGEALKNEEKYQEAIEVFNEALNIRIQVFGKNDKSLSECFYLLGKAYNSQGQIDKAVNSFQKSIQIKKKTLGKNHISLVKDYISLGDLYCKIEQFEQGLEYYQLAFKINKKNPKICTTNAYIHYKIGGIYLILQEYNGAIKELEEGIKVKSKGKELNQVPYFYEIYEMLGVTFFDQQNLVEAKKSYTEALEYCKTELGESAKELYQIYMALGSINSSLKNFVEAEENYNKALQNEIQKHGEKYFTLGYIYHGIANSYFKQGEIDQAVDNHKKSIEFLQEELGSESHYMANLYYDAGFALKEKDLIEEAIEIYEKGMDIIIQKFGIGHSEMAKFIRVLKHLYQKQGMFEEIKRLEFFMRV